MTAAPSVTRQTVFAGLIAFFGFIAVGVGSALAEQVHRERVSFAKGTSAATISGMVKGRDTREYVLGAGAGQHMSVRLASPSDSIYFNVFAPGKLPGRDEALFIGDTGGNTFDGVLSASGDYTVQVYLYRNAARAGERAKFMLDVVIDAAPPSTDAIVPGTEFNATGQINCARDAGQPLGPCKFGVIRIGSGAAELTVFWPDGGSRVIYFENGEPVRYDESQADGGAQLSFTRNDDLLSITIGSQRFEFPDAAVNGG